MSALVFKVAKFIHLESLVAFILRKWSPDFILCFHEVQGSRLSDQVRFLKRIYKPVPLLTLLEQHFASQTRTGKAPQMAFTLDDCLERDMILALPLFAQENTPCTFFVPTNYSVGGKPMWPNKLRTLFWHSPDRIRLVEGERVFGSASEKENFLETQIAAYLYSTQTTEEIEEEVDHLLAINKVEVPPELQVITASGIQGFQRDYPGISDFQSHTMSHLKLALSDPAVIKEEFAGSATYLSHLTGQAQAVVCYPYGSAWHIGNSYLIARDYYRYGLTLIKGVLTKGTDPRYIPRIALYPKDDELRVALKIGAAIFHSVFKGNRPKNN